MAFNFYSNKLFPKLFLVGISIFFYFKSSSQNYTLEDLSRRIVDVINNEDTSTLRSLTLNYSDYKILYNSYLEKLIDTSQVKFEKGNIMNESRFTSAISGIQRNLLTYFQMRKSNNNELKTFKYKNCAYKIFTDENAFTQISNLTIYMLRDTSLFVFDFLNCYKINNCWKLWNPENSGANLNFPLELRLSDTEQNLYNLWEKEYANYHEEKFPYHIAEMFWKQLFLDTSLSMNLFFNKEEFKKSINDKGGTISPTEFDHEYEGYLTLIKSSLSILRDSIKKHDCFSLNYDNKNVVRCQINNHFGSGPDGPNLSANFGFLIECKLSSATIRYFVPNYILLRKLSNSQDWKISFLSYDFKRLQKIDQIVPMISIFY